MPNQTSFIPGRPAQRASPLNRYLPPIPDGAGEAWLRAHTAPGGWVIDPFGASPSLAVEAARSGRQVLVAANNPVARFLLEMAANPPAEQILRAALAEAAASYKGSERLEPHIRSLYATECSQCGREVMAKAFLWERGAAGPSARVYACPFCGDSGERPASQKDLARAVQFSANGLPRARALERVAPLSDPDRHHAVEALEAYLPRAVYALFTLINKLDTISPPRRAPFTALLLSACDQANTLWPHPTARARPRQLTIPPRFWENNVWLALEEAVDMWKAAPTDLPENLLPVVTWPELPPPSGGICLFEGRLKDLVDALPGTGAGLEFQAVLTALPRPNQAYWTLSALWAGWLWGREAAAPLKMALRRRRYDWGWHTTALHSAMSNLAAALKPGTPFFGMIGESEPGFLSSTLIAARTAGFHLAGAAIRLEEGLTQISLVREAAISRQAAGPEVEENLTTLPLLSSEQIIPPARQAGISYLSTRGEPSPYLYLHAAALVELVNQPAFDTSPAETPGETLNLVHSAFQQAFSYRGGFLRFGGSEHSLDTGQWWLREEHQDAAGRGDLAPGQPEMGDATLPLADRVEMRLVTFLLEHPGCSLGEVDAHLCQQFPGLLTPSRELVETCLASYAEPQPEETGRWRLRQQDMPKKRHADLAEIAGLLIQIGERLGFTIPPSADPSRWVLWQDGEELSGAFYLLPSAVLGKALFSGTFPEGNTDLATGIARWGKTTLVYPEARAQLIALKMRSDPRIPRLVDAGLRFARFRLIRRLAENARLTRELFAEQLTLDALDNHQSGPQMALF